MQIRILQVIFRRLCHSIEPLSKILENLLHAIQSSIEEYYVRRLIDFEIAEIGYNGFINISAKTKTMTKSPLVFATGKNP